MLGNSSRNSRHGADLAVTHLSLVLIVCICLFCHVQPAHADIEWSGDLDPDDPTTWTSSTYAYIGKDGIGTLDITDASAVSCRDGRIGYNSGSTGEVTVDGDGSMWTSTRELTVGLIGSGTLNITNGGLVSNAGITEVAFNPGSSGTINFDNGTLSTAGLHCAANNLTGTGTINTRGLVCDVDLVFDTTHGLNQTLTINDNPDQNITLNLDLDGTQPLGLGHSGMGTMSISDAQIVESTDGYIGYNPGSTGKVTVVGDSSTWTNSHYLYIGRYGSGTLNIRDGGKVSNRAGYIGYNPGSTGEVTVDGDGSTWTNGSVLTIGREGNGTLNITDGGAVVNDRSGYIGGDSGSTGEVTVDGVGSTWSINSSELRVGSKGNGTLNITNGGLVSNAGMTKVVYLPGASGTINFDNGTLTTAGLNSAADNLTGTGTINTHGLICDVDLVFDNPFMYEPTQTITINDNPGQNITVNLVLDGSQPLGIGHSGTGTMSISNGVVVESTEGYIGYNPGSTGEVTVAGYAWLSSWPPTWPPTPIYSSSTWTNSDSLYIGRYGSGTLNIIDGGNVSNTYGGIIGWESGSTGQVTVSGAGSKWTVLDRGIAGCKQYVGFNGNGTLNINDGGTVICAGIGHIGFNSGSMGQATVNGPGSTWVCENGLLIRNGMLNITNGGLVSAGTGEYYFPVITNSDTNGDGFINMSNGGMLALYDGGFFGNASGSIAEFLELVGGTDAIRYWDSSISDWANITGATYGEDYILTYFTEDEGYTVLTVMTVPEPSAACGLLVLYLAVSLGWRRGRRRN